MRMLKPRLGDERALTVGALLRSRIKESNVTVAALARDADLCYDYLYAVVNDREKLSIPVALKIGPMLGLDASDLLVLQLHRKIEAVKKMASGAESPKPG